MPVPVEKVSCSILNKITRSHYVPVNPVKAPDDKLAVPSVKENKCSRASCGYAQLVSAILTFP